MRPLRSPDLTFFIFLINFIIADFKFLLWLENVCLKSERCLGTFAHGRIVFLLSLLALPSFSDRAFYFKTSKAIVLCGSEGIVLIPFTSSDSSGTGNKFFV